MEAFVKFLLYTLKTINGQRDSANKILNTLHAQSSKHLRMSQKISNENSENLRRILEYKVFKKVF